MSTHILIVIGLVSAALGWWSATGTKTQAIRLIDVFVYGPLLLALVAWPSLATTGWARGLLVIMGATTITYNARNWFLVNSRE